MVYVEPFSSVLYSEENSSWNKIPTCSLAGNLGFVMQKNQ